MSSRVALRTFGLTLLAALGAPALAQENADKGKDITFVFGWKPGLKINADHKFAQMAVGKTRQTQVKYVMSAGAQGENLTIRFLNPKIVGPVPAVSAGAQAFQEQFGNAAFPELLANKSGEIIQLLDALEQPGRVRMQLEKLVAEKVSGPARIGINNALVPFTSPGFLQARATELWGPIVGAWRGVNARVGEAYEFEQIAPFPLIPGAYLKLKGHFVVVGMLPCTRGGTDRVCAGIQMNAAGDPEDVTRLLEQVRARATASGKSAATFDALTFESELSVITEPDGLFPHEYTFSRDSSLAATKDGKTEKVRRIDLQEVRYSY